VTVFSKKEERKYCPNGFLGFFEIILDQGE